MSSRDCYKTHGVSTPIQKRSLPSIAISTIEETSTQKIRNKANKHFGSSLSSDPRDSKERLASENTKRRTKSRRCISKTPDELRKNRRKFKRNERKRKVRRQLESSSLDGENWLTTREKTVSPRNSENHQQKKSIEHSATENIFRDEQGNSPYYPWERPREAIRDASRFDDCARNILERPLTRVQSPRAKESNFIRRNDEKSVDSDDSVLLVNDHEKCYPEAIRNGGRHSRAYSGKQENWEQINTNVKSMPKTRRVRNRALMMEIRNGDKKLERKNANPREEKLKKKSSCPMETTYGPTRTERKKRLYDFTLPFEESDDETFVIQGIRFLKNPPKPKFFGPLLSPGWEIDMNGRKENMGGSHSREPSRNPKFIDIREFSRVDNCDSSLAGSRNRKRKSPTLDLELPRDRRRVKTDHSKSKSCKDESSNKDERILLEENDVSSGESFITRPLKRRRANKFDLSILESSSGYPVEKRPNSRKLDKSLEKNVVTREFRKNDDSRRSLFVTKNREKPKKKIEFHPTEGRAKKYRRITQLIYSDCGTSPEVATNVNKERLIQRRKNHFSRIVERRKGKILSSSKDITHDASDEATVIENNDRDNELRFKSKSSTLIDKTLPPILEESRSKSYSSSSLPKIMSIRRFSHQLVQKSHSNRWKINLPSVFEL